MLTLPKPDPLEYLVLRKYPKLLFSERNNNSKSLEERHKWEAESQAYRQELLEKTKDEVLELATLERDKELKELNDKIELEDKDRFYRFTLSDDDLSFWSKAAHWTLDEAIALTFGLNPDEVNWSTVSAYVSTSPFAKKYYRLKRLINRALVWQHLYDPILPVLYIAWTKKNDIDFSAALGKIIEIRSGEFLDWKRMYEKLQEIHNNFIAEFKAASKDNTENFIIQADEIIKELNEDLSKMKLRVNELESNNLQSEKDLKTRAKNTLLKLVYGMAVRGYGYDPKALRSQKPKEIAEDLKTLGISIDEDTVRKWLKEAIEILPPEAAESIN